LADFAGQLSKIQRNLWINLAAKGEKTMTTKEKSKISSMGTIRKFLKVGT
jgi:hypothetical protein